MAERRGKFSALAELNRQEPEPVELEAQMEATAEVVTPSAIETGKGRGRPATGKRSNPEWKLYSHFLKRSTQRAAVAKLQAEDSDRDLSDVLEELLKNWLKS
jgi:hypothetical protein